MLSLSETEPIGSVLYVALQFNGFFVLWAFGHYYRSCPTGVGASMPG